MKYLLQDKGALLRAIAWCLVIVLNVLEMIQGNVLTPLATIIVGSIGFYYNNPTSRINCELTGQVRVLKKQIKGIVKGENFLDVITEDEGVE